MKSPQNPSKRVFVPSSDLPGPVPGSGEGLIERKKLPRLEQITKILSGMGIDTSEANFKIEVGEVLDNQMRGLPYNCINLLNEKRTILVCEEQGNATFVFDSDVLVSEQMYNTLGKAITTQILVGMTKIELTDLTKRVRGSGVVLLNRGSIFEKRFKTAMYDIEEVLLELPNRDIKVVKISDEEVKALKLSSIEREISSPVYGLAVDKNGKYWGTLHAIYKYLLKNKKIEVGYDYLLGYILGTRSRYIQQDSAKLFSLDEVIETFNPQDYEKNVESDGEWQGFVYDPNTNLHYGTVEDVVNKLNISGVSISKGTVQDYYEAGKLRDWRKRMRTLDKRGIGRGYCYEDIERLALAFNSAAELVGDDPSEQYVKIDGKHFGTSTYFLHRLVEDKIISFSEDVAQQKKEQKSFKSQINSVIARSKFKLIVCRFHRRGIINGRGLCSYEDFKDAFVKFINIPRINKSGWSDDGEYGTSTAISKKLSEEESIQYSRETVNEKINVWEMQLSEFRSNNGQVIKLARYKDFLNNLLSQRNK